MLDQNTDRMWFVIGAVIVGAAIIFIANGTLPTLFASVSDSFEESANKGLEVIETIGEDNLLFGVSFQHGVWVHESSGNVSETANAHVFSTSDYVPVKGNTKYALRTKGNTGNKRIVYYTSKSVAGYISGDVNPNITADGRTASLISPVNAKYARVSTMTHDYATPVRDIGDPVEDWWFGEI